jgi:DNA-binding IclR family transcriptional regulator
VPGAGAAITVDFVPAPSSVVSMARLGRPSVPHATAAGKVMLAFSDRRPEPPLAAYTERTITDALVLERELETIRERGWADALEEREPGLNAIAAPVRASGDGLAGIVALQGPIPRFGRPAARKALPLLLERTTAISRELGWHSPL